MQTNCLKEIAECGSISNFLRTLEDTLQSEEIKNIDIEDKELISIVLKGIKQIKGDIFSSGIDISLNQWFDLGDK